MRRRRWCGGCSSRRRTNGAPSRRRIASRSSVTRVSFGSALAQNHRVIAVDIRGMGATDKPDGGYDKKTMAEDIRQLVAHFGHGEAHLVGHDVGSQVAYAFAANYPEATTSVTFLDVSAQPQRTRDLRLVPPRPHGDFFGGLLPLVVRLQPGAGPFRGADRRPRPHPGDLRPALSKAKIPLTA